VLVRAKKNFYVGPSRRLAIGIGDVRNVSPSKNGYFWTHSVDGAAFGMCNIKDWEVIDEPDEPEEQKKQ
jgi:hypothetical protein